MNQNELHTIKKEVEENKEKLIEIHESVERIRSYFFWMLVAVVISFVLPLIGLLFAIPKFIQTYSSLGGVL